MFISKSELIENMKKAERRIRILGVLAFSFDWDLFRDEWFSRINEGTLHVEIIREAEHFVYNQAIIASDRRISNENRSYELGSFLNTLMDPEVKLRKYFVDKNCRNIEPYSDMLKNEGEEYTQCFSLRTCYLQIPTAVLNIDDDYYITLSLTKFNNAEKFEKIENEHPWKREFYNYFHAYFDSPYGGIKYSTEETAKGNRLEIIQSYNESRRPIGILPRDSFLDTRQCKVVVWGLAFTRDGKMLIHRRKDNARDNRGMWDKSVGGHVDIDDIDTAKAIARELAEELYKQEINDQGGHGTESFIDVNKEKLIFLGEWLPKKRNTMPFEDVNNRMDEYYYFRMDYSFSNHPRRSERHLPNSVVEDVYVFADVYVCIVSEQFKIEELQNSDYKIMDLHEIKDAFNEKIIREEKNGKILEEKFLVSPDLKSIINSSLWDQLSSFSDYVQEAYRVRR